MATINPLQQPINYSVDVQSPFEAALSGLKLGAAGAEAQTQATAREKAKATQTGIDTFFKKPAQERNYTDLEPLLLGANKQQFDALQAVSKNMSEEKLKSSQRFTGQLLVALEQNPDTAKKLLEDRIAAETDPQQSLAWKDTLKTIDISPKKAADTIELLGAATFGKDWYESITNVRRSRETSAEAVPKLSELVAKAQTTVADLRIKLQNEPIEAERLLIKRDLEVAQADKAKVDAKYAEQVTKLGIRKTEEDIIINKENARIAGLTAAQLKETNVLKREELQQKIDEAKEKRDATDREQKATVSNQSADIDNFLNTAQRVLNTPENVIKSATGPVASRLPTTSGDVADFEALVEALGSQAFIAQIPKIKGTGSLSEKEGDKLQASLQTLTLKQSPARLKENVTEAVRLLTKVRENIALKYGVEAPRLDVPAALQVSVQLPNGQTVRFPNQASADAYKKAAGIK